jgi:hypothetical protein
MLFGLPLCYYPTPQLCIHDTITRFSVVHWPEMLYYISAHK